MSKTYTKTKATEGIIERFEEPIVEIVKEPVVESEFEFKVSANVPIILETEEGYFKSSNKNIQIQRRTINQVIFSIPFGIKEVVVEVQEKGDIVEKTYRVV
jgi:hypothetical protein